MMLMMILLSRIYPPEGADPWIYIPLVIIVFLILLIVGIKNRSIYK